MTFEFLKAAASAQKTSAKLTAISNSQSSIRKMLRRGMSLKVMEAAASAQKTSLQRLGRGEVKQRTKVICDLACYAADLPFNITSSSSYGPHMELAKRQIISSSGRASSHSLFLPSPMKGVSPGR